MFTWTQVFCHISAKNKPSVIVPVYVVHQCMCCKFLMWILDILAHSTKICFGWFMYCSVCLCYYIPATMYDLFTYLFRLRLYFNWRGHVIKYDEIHSILTHWGRVTHICVGNLTIIGSDNDLSPGRRLAIIWTNAGILLIGPLGINFSEILIEIITFWFHKMRLKVSSAKRRPFCLDLNVLMSRCYKRVITGTSHFNSPQTKVTKYHTWLKLMIQLLLALQIGLMDDDTIQMSWQIYGHICPYSSSYWLVK